MAATMVPGSFGVDSPAGAIFPYSTNRDIMSTLSLGSILGNLGGLFPEGSFARKLADPLGDLMNNLGVPSLGAAALGGGDSTLVGGATPVGQQRLQQIQGLKAKPKFSQKVLGGI